MSLLRASALLRFLVTYRLSLKIARLRKQSLLPGELRRSMLFFKKLLGFPFVIFFDDLFL